VTPRLADLSPEQQAKIRELLATAPPLSPRQRARLEVLFRPSADEAGAGE
jgi:hypothetical protein